MLKFSTQRRLIGTATYALMVTIVLGWFYQETTFCDGPGKIRQIASLVFIEILIEIFAGSCNYSIWKLTRGELGGRFAGPAISGLIAALLNSVLPQFMYLGYGHWRFEGTWMDLRCLFSEGYGLVFMTLGAITFGVLTCLCEWFVTQRTKKSQD